MTYADKSIPAATAPVDATVDGSIKQVSLDQAAEAERPVTERKVIRDGNLVLEVVDPADGQRKASAIADANEGFLVTSDMQQGAGSSQIVTITMRIPAARFEAVMEALRGIGSKVVSEKVTGQDVTEEYIDLEARLKTKQALEAQFLEIMKQAHSVEDALEVQKQIAEVRGEIESLEGRRRFLENRASLSTITVRLQGPQPVVTASRSGIGDAFRYAFGDAVDTANAIITGFIRVVGVLIPVVILIGIPMWLLIRFLLRRSRKTAADERG